METDDPTWRFEGFSSPNFTTVPDELFDVLAPRLSGAEVKVLLYIIRRTFGFKKERDSISLSQMLNGIVKRNGERLDYGAGLSKPTLCRALATLAEKGVIISMRQFDYKGANMATSYQLNMRGCAPAPKKEEAEDTLGKKMRQGGVSQNFTKGESQFFTKPLVKKRDIQETVNKKQDDKNVTDTKKAREPGNPLHLLPDVHSEPDLIQLIADDILDALGDQQSAEFYHLVARKVPEGIIRRTLSELKEGRARSRAKVFTYTVMQYAKGQVALHLADRSHDLKESKERLLARLRYE